MLWRSNRNFTESLYGPYKPIIAQKYRILFINSKELSANCKSDTFLGNVIVFRHNFVDGLSNNSVQLKPMFETAELTFKNAYEIA